MMREFTEDELRLRELYPSYYCSHCGAQAVCGIKHECVGTLRADLDREKGRRIAREVERDNAERDRDLAEDTIATLRAEVAGSNITANTLARQLAERDRTIGRVTELAERWGSVNSGEWKFASEELTRALKGGQP